MKRRSETDQWVFQHSTKPSHYKEVKNPPKTDEEKRMNPQAARQIQYNRWSKYHRIYSGSYLPANDSKLLRQGWVDETHPKDRSNEKLFRRKSTNQWVQHDYNKNSKNTDHESAGRHWHWFHWWHTSYHKRQKIGDLPYYDKYGNPCKKGKKNSPHHIGEEGKDYTPWQKHIKRR